MNRGIFGFPRGAIGRLHEGVRSLGYGDDEYFAGFRSGDVQLVDWREHDVQRVVLTGNITASTMRPPLHRFGRLLLKLEQDSTGSRTVVWPSNLIWDRLATPVLSSAAGTVDVIALLWDGTNFRASIWTGS